MTSDVTEEFDARLSETEAALSRGEMNVAASLAAHLAGDYDLDKVSATQLARLSLVYMQMADESDEGENTAMATDLYRRAYNMSADSAAEYFARVPFEKMQYVNMLHTLTQSIDSPIKEIFDYHDYDSLSVQISADSITSSDINRK